MRLEYEIETKLENKSRDLTFAEDGTLLEVEQKVELASIPKAARNAIEKRAQAGKITYELVPFRHFHAIQCWKGDPKRYHFHSRRTLFRPSGGCVVAITEFDEELLR